MRTSFVDNIKTTPATAEEESWVEYQRKESQEAPRRLEDTAKFLSGLTSISLTLLLGPFNEVLKSYRSTTGLKLGIACWLLSIVLTLAVVFPFRYRYVGNSETSIRRMNKKIAKIKFILLLIGSLCYLAGISLVAYICLFYPNPK